MDTECCKIFAQTPNLIGKEARGRKGERIKENERIFFRTQKMVGKQSGGAAEEVGTGEEGGNAHVRAGEVIPTRYR